MTNEQRLKLESIGINIEETLDRFVDNEVLFFKCITKLLDDKNYSLLLDGIENNDVNKAFAGVHALKGVSANLGLSYIFNEANILTEVFRAESMSYDEANLKRLSEEYLRAISVIQNL